MKKTLKVIALTCIGGLLSIQQVEAKDKMQELSFWVIKTSYNYYYINTPSGQLDGLEATSARIWSGVFPESSVEGNLRGFTVDIGRIFKSRNNLRLISIDLTSRIGDLDGYIIYHKNTEDVEK